VFGLFWGAPLVARELESGTIAFTWMQSVSPSRWLAVQLAWILLATAVRAGTVAVLVTGGTARSMR